MGFSIGYRRCVAGLLLALGGCRGHTSVCTDSECVAPLTGTAGSTDVGAGGGGAPPVLASQGGEGGREAECQNDADCARGTACDGRERCLEGSCVVGEPPSCQHGTKCDPRQQAELCVYPEPSPWLLIATDERILGLPTALLGSEPLATLAEREDATPQTSLVGTIWSPTGAEALVLAKEKDEGFSVSRLRFGAGVPEMAASFDNLPHWFDIESALFGFSLDGERLAVGDEAEGWLYLVSLENPPAPTLRSPGGFLSFCADSTTWIAPEGLVTLVEGELVTQELADLTASPDAQWVVQPGLEAGLFACSAGAEKVPLGAADAVTWSANSQFLAVENDDGSLRLLSLADPSQPREVWSHPNAVFSAFSADSKLALVDISGAERHSLVNLDETAPVATELMLDTAPVWSEVVSDRALLAHQHVFDDDRYSVLWQPLRPGEPPQVVRHDCFIIDEDAARGVAVLSHDTDNDDRSDETLLVRFDADGFRVDELSPMDPEGGFSEFKITPDGSGIFQHHIPRLTPILEWFAFDPETGDLSPSVLVAEGVNSGGFQPWP